MQQLEASSEYKYINVDEEIEKVLFKKEEK